MTIFCVENVSPKDFFAKQKKVQAILALNPPNNVKELRHFLGKLLRYGTILPWNVGEAQWNASPTLRLSFFGAGPMVWPLTVRSLAFYRTICIHFVSTLTQGKKSCLNPGSSGMLCYSVCNPAVCTSMANTKSVTKGVMIKRVLLYNTKKTQVKNISHSALPQKYPLKTMPPRHPRPFSAPTPACTCSLRCCLGCRLGGAVEFARPVANCDLYPTPRPKIRQKSHSKNIVTALM